MKFSWQILNSIQYGMGHKSKKNCSYGENCWHRAWKQSQGVVCGYSTWVFCMNDIVQSYAQMEMYVKCKPSFKDATMCITSQVFFGLDWVSQNICSTQAAFEIWGHHSWCKLALYMHLEQHWIKLTRGNKSMMRLQGAEQLCDGQCSSRHVCQDSGLVSKAATSARQDAFMGFMQHPGMGQKAQAYVLSEEALICLCNSWHGTDSQKYQSHENLGTEHGRSQGVVCG